MTTHDKITLSRWAAGLIVAGLGQAAVVVWWAAGISGSLELIRAQQNFVVERVKNVESDLKDVKHQLNGYHASTNLHPHS